MNSITDTERDQASEILETLKTENGKNYQKLKDKANWEKISLMAVLLQWGHPKGWF